MFARGSGERAFSVAVLQTSALSVFPAATEVSRVWRCEHRVVISGRKIAPTKYHHPVELYTPNVGNWVVRLAGLIWQFHTARLPCRPDFCRLCSARVTFRFVRLGAARFGSFGPVRFGFQLATWMLNDGLMELLFSAEFLHTETLKR